MQPKGMQVTCGTLQKNSNLKFFEISSTPLHGAVDQDLRSKLHLPKHTSKPPMGPCWY